MDSLVDAGPYGTDNFSETEFAGIVSSNLSVPRSALTDWMRTDSRVAVLSDSPRL